MAKQQKSPPPVKDREGACFKDTKPQGVNPLKQQFEPTPSAPMRQHFKMAGGC